MEDEIRQLAPHLSAMGLIYIVAFWISAFVFGYGDIWTAFAIGVAIIYGYKPAIVALGYGPPSWTNEISRDDD